MRIAGDWLETPGLQAVMAAIGARGHRALLVGGTVRNAVMGIPVSDFDIATDARPDEVVDLAAAAGLKTVPTGIEHGTVTVIAAGRPHEVTTFRRDVETFGRHATVAFGTDLAADAARRDFTMNALYADRSGEVLDPLGGLPDVLARRLRFVGDADARIREDYLRILRFFRFYAWYADPDLGPDTDALAACAANSAGTETLSRERIGAEMLKLLAAPDPAPALAMMQAAGVLGCALPGADARAIAPLVHLEDGLVADPLRRLAALGGEDVADRLRLSRDDARTLAAIREGATEPMSTAELGWRLGLRRATDALLVRAALTGMPPAPDSVAEVARGAAAEFPVSARDLMPELSGAALGARLKELEREWIASGLRATKTGLLR